MSTTTTNEPSDRGAQDRENWAGTITYGAERIVRPTDPTEVPSLVAGADRVRGLGTRHSFTDVADGPGLLVDLTGLPTVVDVAPDRLTATVTAGTRYGDLAVRLDAEGLALSNMGSLPHISVGGAVATGTHGSGIGLGSLSSTVAALEFVGADGSTRTVRRGDADFGGHVLHFGLLGLVTRVTVDVEPAYRMRQDAYADLPWDVFLADVEGVMGAGTSVSGFTEFDGRVREFLVKTRVPVDADGVDVPATLHGAAGLPPRGATDRRTPIDGTVGPWWDRLPHFRIEGTPSVGSEIQSEHFVPLRLAAGALEAVAALGDRIRPHLHTSELRTMAGDDLWLSPTQGESTLGIAFTWQKHPAEVAALLPDIEAALAPFGGRPHWGKSTSLGADAIAALYPRLDEFRALVRRVDPAGTFRNAWAERLLGL